MIYNVTKSLIDNDGYQYICGMLQEPKLNDRGLWHRIKAFDILLNHKKQKSTLSVFYWINGVPCDFKNIKEFKNEIIDETEVERVLEECGLITEDFNAH